MSSETADITTLYDKVAKAIGFSFNCTCKDSEEEVCSCTSACYCIVVKRSVLNAVIALVKKDDVSCAIQLFQDIGEDKAAMIECADFIHRVRSKEKEALEVLP